MEDEFKIPLQVDNAEVLDRFKEGLSSQSAITLFGSIDGIALIYILTRSRPNLR